MLDKISRSNSFEENMQIIEMESRRLFNSDLEEFQNTDYHADFDELVTIIKNNKDKSVNNLQNQLLSKLEKELTLNQLHYVNQMVELTSSLSLTKAEVMSKFDLMEDNIRRNVPKHEQPALLAGLYMGKSSYQYWQENGSKWAEKLQPENLRLTGHPTDGQLICGADVAGAISGALSVGFAAWAVGPVGWVFGTLFIAGSALVSSGGAALIVYSK